ncbi:baseplate hub [Serratia phage 92A1]|nr:baseplate hub [Serratia phage 92A1]
MMQRPGFPSVRVKLFEDYDAWLDNRYLDLSATFYTITIRDSLNGVNEGLIQIYDNKDLQQKMDGNEIISISLGNANEAESYPRIYGVKHSAASVDEKGDNIIVVQLGPIHRNMNTKFGRSFHASATDSITEMMDALYVDKPLLKPKVLGQNVHVPKVPWVQGYAEYMNFVRDYGLSIDSDQFVFAWEDFNGIQIIDFDQISKQEIRQFAVGEPSVAGEFNDKMQIQLMWDWEWLTRHNASMRNEFANSTVYTHSFLDKNCLRITNGTGVNTLMVARSGGYAEQIYRNGYEEATRISTMANYDSYAKCTGNGDFSITPGLKCQFWDPKNQFVVDYYIDEVIHEISMEKSLTHMYIFGNSAVINPVVHTKVKNEIKSYTADENTES